MTLDDLIKNLKTRYEIIIGFPKDKQVTYPPDRRKGRELNKGGQSVASVAAIQEYGKKGSYWAELKGKKTIDIPSRPFLRTALRKNRARIIKQVKEALLDPKNKEILFEAIGIDMVDKVQDSILHGNWQPNSPRTIAIKKSSKPLIDRSIMINAVRSEVKKYR